MCGIAGFYGFNGNQEESIDTLRRMLTRIRHRGPDDSGIYLSKNVGLGSVRLNIIDPDNGTMPISNRDNSIWIVYNGEVFNFVELGEELSELGYIFKTQSDTEVILHMYEEYGHECFKKLNGQFAVAIWDQNKQELLLARDRFGIRPLFYTQNQGSLVFGSEIKSFLEFPGIDLKMSSEVIKEYFTFWAALSPRTLFENIFEVPPGSLLIIKKESLECQKYWEIPLYDSSDLITDSDQAATEFEELFRDSVRLRLRADVPVAAYLSGGIDSCCTTAFIKELHPETLKTFSITFKEADFDESYYQRLAVDFYRTTHCSFECGAEEISENFKSAVWHCESPLLRTSPIPMKLLANYVHDENIKVVVTGEGADEILGGYNIFKETKIRRFWAKQPDSHLRPKLLKKLYPYLPHIYNASSNVLKSFFGYRLQEIDSVLYSHLLRWKNTSRINGYLSESFSNESKKYDPIKKYEQMIDNKLNGSDYLSKAQYIEINLFMSGYLLSSQGDRMAMAHSIEGRYPFLDHRLTEFCMRLSPDLKLNGLNEKYLLKRVMKGKVPDEILRRSKQAYRAPVRSALVSDRISEYFNDLMSENRIQEFGIFKPFLVRRLIEKIKSGRKVSEIDNMALTGIFSVQILYDLFIKKSFQALKEADLISIKKLVVN